MTYYNLFRIAIERYYQQKNKRKEHFHELKEKYAAIQCIDTSFDSLLYQILQNLEAGKTLKNDEIKYLKTNNLTETLAIADFVALKFKYKAIANKDLSLSSHLCKVLNKINSNILLSESDLNFLKKRKLTETITIAIDQYANYLINEIELGQQLNEAQLQWVEKNEVHDVIELIQIKHFQKLKQKYEVYNFPDNSSESKLYLILQKLDKNQRLDAIEIVYLEERKLFYGVIRKCYHTIEAQFYETEYKKTGNRWSIPNISSHWRKADQPEKALQSTENINFDKIKEDKLKSAILTTRGGAFRDVRELDEAKKCARKAIHFQPSSHHPYTLMGAICYDRYQNLEGERWFKKAIERGASPESIDSEIKKSIARMKDKDKRNKMIRDLLKKDPDRYSWAKKYLSKNNRKKRS